jgi:hypothetical protein
MGSNKMKKKLKSKRNKLGLLSFTVLFASVGVYFIINSFAATPQTCTSVSQNFGTVGTITYQFDKTYPCGMFANSDWWVSPNSGDTGVIVTGISPASSGGKNGWESNPSNKNKLAYDSRLAGYDASLMPTLPYTATGDKSIVKTISVPAGDSGCSGGADPCLAAASVLTVLSTQPPNQGSNIFRPAYYGSTKRLFTTDQLDTSKLPSLDPVANAPTLAQVTTRFQHVQLDDQENYTSRNLHPQTSFFNMKTPSVFSDYGSDLTNDNTEAALRLMLNDSVSAKMPALINYVQAGIDWYGIKKGGMNWYASGGHQQGRKLPIAFAAVLLNDTDMKAVVHDASYDSFSEDGHTYWSSVANNGKGMALFGAASCSSGDYEYNQTTGGGSRDCRDPTGQIDGGQVPGDWYQYCCTAKNYEYISLAVRLMPDVRTVWNYEPFHQYVDRWMDFGTWSSPDPSNRTTGTSMNTGARVLASSLHGTNKGGGTYNSTFGDSMWGAYRSRIDDWYASYVSGSTSCTSTKGADINCDNNVNVTDLSILLSNYGKNTAQLASSTPSYPRADINSSGKVDIGDLSTLLTGYGK